MINKAETMMTKVIVIIIVIINSHVNGFAVKFDDVI